MIFPPVPKIKVVRKIIRRNPVGKQKILSPEMKIGPRTISRILSACEKRTGHFLTDNLKRIWW